MTITLTKNNGYPIVLVEYDGKKYYEDYFIVGYEERKTDQTLEQALNKVVNQAIKQ